GETWSTNFPLANPEQNVPAGDTDIFVTKWNSAGTGILYSTYIGGSNRDAPQGIAVDSTGQAYLSGYTASIDFPVSSEAFQSSYGGGASDGFFAKLNAAGSQLVYATYLGGIGNDTAFAVALDPAANVYLTGQTQSSNFPVLNALQPSYSESAAFVVKLNASSQVLYSTYLGGTGSSIGTGIAADAAGNAYVAGYTNAPDFPVTSNAYQLSNHGSYDTFVAKLSSDGSTILSATY